MKSSVTIHKLNIYFFIFFASLVTGCKKYLDAKSDKKLVIPSSLQDAQALLDYYSRFNASYPTVGEKSNDDYYLLDNYWNTLNADDQNLYAWNENVDIDNDWTVMYYIVANANIALETVEKIQPESSNINEWKRIKGGGHFFRAYAFFHIAQYFADPYDKVSAGQMLGIPLRLNTNTNEISVRSTLEETWKQIIEDFKIAAELLPNTTEPVSRPSKPAAYGALARTYLAMNEFELARKYADSCLILYNTLMDYNDIQNPTGNAPFQRYNPEVIFQSALAGAGMLSLTNRKIDSLLYKSYDNNDLRKAIFFKSNGTGTFGFKGNYDGTTGTTFFNGIATDEVYLIRAESAARMGDKDLAIDDLNTLLEKRWITGTFAPFVASDASEALVKVLDERRKELISRGLRWFDLRRFNQSPQFSKDLIRMLNGQILTLKANSPKFTFYIPQQVIQLSGMQQNDR